MNKVNNLTDLRLAITGIDEKILCLLCERKDWVTKVGLAKQEQGLAVRDEKVEGQKILDLKISAINKGVNPEMVEQIFRIIMNGAVLQQEVQKQQRGNKTGFGNCT